MDPEIIKTILLQKQSELTQRVEKIEIDFSTRKISKNFGQQNKQRENDDVLTALNLEAKDELDQIKHALGRVESDMFNQCEQCGKDIGDERLLAVPYTAYCRNCADKQ